jgi:hypothetical protein
MKTTDFTVAAAVYVQIRGANWSARGRAPKKYYRFDSLALAVQYAVENSHSNLSTVVIETEDSEFAGDGVRTLYESEDYPLPRK